MAPKKKASKRGIPKLKRIKAKSYPAFVKGYRERHGLTTTQLGEMLGYPRSFISAVERGMYVFPHGFLKALYQHLTTIDDKRQLVECVAESAADYIQEPNEK